MPKSLSRLVFKSISHSIRTKRIYEAALEEADELYSEGYFSPHWLPVWALLSSEIKKHKAQLLLLRTLNPRMVQHLEDSISSHRIDTDIYNSGYWTVKHGKDTRYHGLIRAHFNKNGWPKSLLPTQLTEDDIPF